MTYPSNGPTRLQPQYGGWGLTIETIQKQQQQVAIEQAERLRIAALPKCDLCGDRDSELREFGSPILYWACANVSCCDRRQRDNLSSHEQSTTNSMETQ